MPIEILMPALSPTMTEGTLSKWVKKEGDSIKAGEVIAEIETDKATMEVEAVDEGILGKIVVPEGTEGVPVNNAIALLLEKGEDKKVLEGYQVKAGAKKEAPKEEAKQDSPTPKADAGPEQKGYGARALAAEPTKAPELPGEARNPQRRQSQPARPQIRQRQWHRPIARGGHRPARPRGERRCRKLSQARRHFRSCAPQQRQLHQIGQ